MGLTTGGGCWLLGAAMATPALRHFSGRAASDFAGRALLAFAALGASPAFADEPAPASPPPAAEQPVAGAATQTSEGPAAPALPTEPAAKPTEPDLSREQAQVAAATRREEEAKRGGKTGLAQRLAALSTRWLAVVEALRTASKLEAEAADLEKERLRVREQTDRVITLLEQTEARRARALARLQELGLEPSGLPVPTVPPAPSGAGPAVPQAAVPQAAVPNPAAPGKTGGGAP